MSTFQAEAAPISPPITPEQRQRRGLEVATNQELTIHLWRIRVSMAIKAVIPHLMQATEEYKVARRENSNQEEIELKRRKETVLSEIQAYLGRRGVSGRLEGPNAITDVSEISDTVHAMLDVYSKDYAELGLQAVRQEVYEILFPESFVIPRPIGADTDDAELDEDGWENEEKGDEKERSISTRFRAAIKRWKQAFTS